ncbi:MAG: pilus assembly protein TadG-related protein [Caldilineaceae bacterium]
MNEESGQSMVVAALFMIAFIGMLGLVIDMGMGYAKYRQMQTAADTAALAATRELALGNGDAAAIDRITQTLLANGADVDLSEYTLTEDHAEVTARTRYTPAFTPIFGLTEIPVNAAADAQYGRQAQSGDLLPFAVDQDLWVLDQEVNIWIGETGPGGNFGWVHWGGQSQSSSVLRANIDDTSNSGVVTIGDQIAGKTGVSISSVRGSLNNRVGEVIDVFFYDPDEITGSGANLRYTVTGFGKFRVTGVTVRGRSQIRGYFEQSVVLGGKIIPGMTLGSMAAGLVD